MPAPDGGRDLVMAARGRAALPEDAPVVDLAHRRRARRLALPAAVRPASPLDDAGASGWWRADFVTTDDGSGIVHLAPAFGEDDAAVGRAEGLPVLNPVDADGAFDDRVPPLARAGS